MAEFSPMESSSAQTHTNLHDLPENCIFTILSFTTPRDACKLATVCKLFRSAVCSDSFWDKWIPPNHQQILPTPLHFSGKKELYFHLCQPILIDGGTKMFWLDRSTGKICYMLSAKELSILWGAVEPHWRWICDASTSISSRFEEVAQIWDVARLEVRGKFDCRLLSANTEYFISYLIQFGSRAVMWNVVPVNFGVKTAEGDEKEFGRLLKEGKGEGADIERDNGWTEIIAGEFKTKEYSDLEGCIEFWMEEVNHDGPWKTWLFLDGIIIKPKSV